MTDDSDPTKQELLNRVEQLESTVEKMLPSRREALKLGAAGAASVGGVSLLSGGADASTGSAGQIGEPSPSNRPDIFADTVDANQLTGVSTGGALTFTRAVLTSASSADPIPFEVGATGAFDPDNNFVSVLPGVSAPADGTYQINVHTQRDGDTSNGGPRIEKNGQAIAKGNYDPSNGFSARNTMVLTQAKSGDNLTVANPSNINYRANSPAETYLEIIRLA
jgi:hypothetical protein